MKQVIIIVVVVGTLIGSPVMAEPLSVADLIENTLKSDGQVIEISGEAIGDVLSRGQSGWVNILDQGVAIGVWAGNDQLQKIKWLGSYKQRGDTVRVVGVFNRACTEHGGELDVHASDIRVDVIGEATYRPLEYQKVYFAFVLVPATVAVAWLSRRANRKMERSL